MEANNLFGNRLFQAIQRHFERYLQRSLGPPIAAHGCDWHS
jgi:hypothetical protein